MKFLIISNRLREYQKGITLIQGVLHVVYGNKDQVTQLRQKLRTNQHNIRSTIVVLVSSTITNLANMGSSHITKEAIF